MRRRFIIYMMCPVLCIVFLHGRCNTYGFTGEYITTFVVNQVHGGNGLEKWTPSDISALRHDIQELKLSGVLVLGSYHKSVMGTLKCHMLYHVADNRGRNGRLYLCDAGPYKNAHTIFKQSYPKTSKRRTSAIYESISIVDRRLRDDSIKSPLKRPKTLERNENDQKPVDYCTETIMQRLYGVCQQGPYDSHSCIPLTNTWYSILNSCQPIFLWSKSRAHIIRHFKWSVARSFRRSSNARTGHRRKTGSEIYASGWSIMLILSSLTARMYP